MCNLLLMNNQGRLFKWRTFSVPSLARIPLFGDLVGNRSYTDYQHVTAHFDTFWSVYQKSMDLSALSLLATVISLNQVVLAGHPYTPYLLIN